MSVLEAVEVEPLLDDVCEYIRNRRETPGRGAKIDADRSRAATIKALPAPHSAVGRGLRLARCSSILSKSTH